ncbi:MAG TPA: hypothetical protein VIR02_20430 [Anaerolineales bacterium]
MAFASSEPVIAAAGDIACDPANAPFNGGAGTANAARYFNYSGSLAGNGSYNLALTTPGSTAISFASRQAGTNSPQLIVETTPWPGTF